MRAPRMLEPLRIRDFRLLWTGMTVSLVGDGIFLVALAWQTYDLSNSPSALGWISAAYVTPMVVFLLAGGVLTDRIDRRKLMIAADVIRAAAIGAVGVLAVSGDIRLWQLALFAGLTGVGDALFAPAFGSIVPEIVPRELLAQANSLDQFVRPLSGLVGPAIAGVLIASSGVGTAFLADAATFGVSGVTALLLTPRPLARSPASSAWRELREGFAFVRARTWLWATLLAAAIIMVGPSARNVLLPYLVKNNLHASAGALGLVYSSTAAGAILAALAFGQRGTPRRFVLAAYVAWAVSLLVVAGYGVAQNIAELVALGFVAGVAIAFGQAIWGTMLHRLVPREVLGRVTSLDWMMSTSLMPVWLIGIGFAGDGIGVRKTLVVAGLFAAIVTMLFPLAIRAIRDPERESGSLGKPAGEGVQP